MREPDLYIGGKEKPYLLRWWLIPRNRRFNIYLHKMVRDDDDRALHDHPWWYVSIILWGGYVEVTPKFMAFWKHVRKGEHSALWLYYLCPSVRRLVEGEKLPGMVLFRPRFWPHRLKLIGNVSWSLVITGSDCQDWGFYCNQGWVSKDIFCKMDGNESVVSRGCD